VLLKVEKPSSAFFLSGIRPTATATRAAGSLGISRMTLYKKMKKHGLMKIASSA
jgi:DNA-binding protein Fis